MNIELEENTTATTKSSIACTTNENRITFRRLVRNFALLTEIEIGHNLRTFLTFLQSSCQFF